MVQGYHYTGVLGTGVPLFYICTGLEQTCQPPENSKREIAQNSDVSTKLACNLRARFKTYKISKREIFSSGGRFLAAFQKDNTCYWQKKRSILLACTDTKPIKQGKIETVSYLRY